MCKKILSLTAATVCVIALLLSLGGCFGDSGYYGDTGTTYTRYTFRDFGSITDNTDSGYTTAPSYGGYTTARTQVNNSGTARTERLPNLSSTYHNNLLLCSRANGGCDRLEGNVKVTVVFVDDNVKAWNSADMAAEKKNLQEGTDFLVSQAKKYGKNLSFSFVYKTARTNQSVSMKDSADWAKAVGATAGLPNFSALNDTLENRYGADEAPVVFCINHTGRSFAQSDWTAEYAVLYNDGNPTAHELLHLFGARDYYMPDAFKQAATDIYGKTIMKDASTDPVDSLSAYLVGWTDTPDSKAMQMLQKTNHITQAMVDEAYKHNTTTGYVTNWKTSDGNYFTGNLVEGYFGDGQGTLVYADGGKYVGNFKDTYFHGQGTFTWANGDKYVGAWNKGERTGQGTLTYANGDKYVGAFVKGTFHGQGTLTWKGGSKYTGTWNNGERTGQGTYTYSDGSTYVGAFVNGSFHGQGTYTWKNGDKYVGQWVNGQRTGYGTYTWKSGESQSGQWENGKFIG